MQITAIKEKYSAEIALIVLCCRHYIQTADNNSILIFLQENELDWSRVFQLSKAHRISPICYKTLSVFKEIIGNENLEEFRNYSMYFNAFALNNKRELNRIVELLKQNNIAAKSFKGIDFGETFYGDIALREFSDNDIIIRDSAIDCLIDVMEKEGYYSKDLKYYTKFPVHYIRDYKDIIFEKGNGLDREFAFEFHFKTSRYFQDYSQSFAELLGQDYLLNSRKYDEIDYLKIMTLNNGLMDFYPDLRSILDLAVIFKKNENIALTTIDSTIRNYLNYGVTISFELLNYPINRADIRLDKKAVNFCDDLLENILSTKNAKRISILKVIQFSIKNTQSVKGKLKHLKNYFLLMVRPNLDDITTVNLPYYLLYYFTKPFRILSKVFRSGFVL